MCQATHYPTFKIIFSWVFFHISVVFRWALGSFLRLCLQHSASSHQPAFTNIWPHVRHWREVITYKAQKNGLFIALLWISTLQSVSREVPAWESPHFTAMEWIPVLGWNRLCILWAPVRNMPGLFMGTYLFTQDSIMSLAISFKRCSKCFPNSSSGQCKSRMKLCRASSFQNISSEVPDPLLAGQNENKSQKWHRGLCNLMWRSFLQQV